VEAGVTLRMRLSLAFLFIVIVPLVVAAVVVGRGVPHALDTSAGNRLDASRASAVAFLRTTCVQVRLAAEVLAREAAVTPAAQRDRVAADVVDRGVGDYAVLTDDRGTTVSRAGALPASTSTGAAEIGPAQLGSCSRRLAPANGLPVIADFIDVQSSTGTSLGRAAVAVAFDARTARQIAGRADADVTLVASGHVLASTEPSPVATTFARLASSMSTTDGDKVGDRLAVAIAAPPTNAVIVLSVSRSEVHGLLWILIGVLLAALLLSAAIGAWLARLTTQPLAQLSDAAARVAAGDFDTTIEMPQHDEVGRLAASFNEMTRELRGYVGEVESSRDQLRENLTRLGDTLSGTHDLGRILTVILDTAIDTVRAAAGAAYVTQPGRDSLTLRASRGLEDRQADPRLTVGQGVAGAVAATGEARLGRVGADGLTLAAGEPTGEEVISVPLRVSSGVLGVLNLYDRTDGRPFDAHDLETVRSFASQAAVAIDNVLLHQEAQRLSVTDALTGLGNYRSFQQILSREIERAARFERSLGLLMLDLDLFKSVNDVHGHQVGNAVLVEVAERLRTEVREVDVVARYGGEEFAVILPESDSDGSGHTAERICRAMRARPFAVGDLELTVTVSIGVAVFPRHGQSGGALVRAADEALYAAKAGGRDQWRTAAGQPDADASLGLPT
jgi:two-component system, cell cycle response regulator